MQPIDASGRYGDSVVAGTLQGLFGVRRLSFRYELLDRFNVKKADLVGVLSGSISYDASADVKRTGTFMFREGYDSINYLSDRVKPWVQLGMGDGLVVEWPQGVFLLSSPDRSLATSGVVTRSVTAYDQLVVLSSDTTSDRYSITAGTYFSDAIHAVVDGSIPQVFITGSALTLPVTWDYEAGTSKLTILNDLLSAMNYRSAWFDENGRLVCEPYVLPEQRTVGYTYATDQTSLIMGDIDQALDLFDVPNRWTLVVSDTDQGSFSSTYTNTSSTSPTSTVSRGRTISVLLDGQSAADQATLDALTLKQAYQDSQVFETVAFDTAIMPFHSNADVLGLSIGGLALGSEKFEELSWAYELKVGASMSHTVRRTVSV